MHLKYGTHLLVAAHIQGYERRKYFAFFLLALFFLPGKFIIRLLRPFFSNSKAYFLGFQ